MHTRYQTNEMGGFFLWGGGGGNDELKKKRKNTIDNGWTKSAMHSFKEWVTTRG